MRSFTQRDLLSEGFWDAFHQVKRGAKFLAKHAAPKTYAGAKATYDYVKGAKDAFSPIQKLAKKQLEDMGYKMIDNTWKQQGKNFVVLATPMTEASDAYELDPATGKPIKDPATQTPLIDPATGNPQIDPATGQPIMDPKSGEYKVKIDPTTNQPQIDIGPGKPVPFIVDKDTGKPTQIHGRNRYGQQGQTPTNTTTASPSGAPTPTGSPLPTSTPPISSPPASGTPTPPTPPTSSPPTSGTRRRVPKPIRRVPKPPSP